jgi:hypothetical protein
MARGVHRPSVLTNQNYEPPNRIHLRSLGTLTLRRKRPWHPRNFSLRSVCSRCHLNDLAIRADPCGNLCAWGRALRSLPYDYDTAASSRELIYLTGLKVETPTRQYGPAARVRTADQRFQVLAGLLTSRRFRRKVTGSAGQVPPSRLRKPASNGRLRQFRRSRLIAERRNPISPCESASPTPPDSAPKTRRSAGG